MVSRLKKLRCIFLVQNNLTEEFLTFWARVTTARIV
jgi:hypothetical protein